MSSLFLLLFNAFFIFAVVAEKLEVKDFLEIQMLVELINTEPIIAF